jgi:hypothetical protein
LDSTASTLNELRRPAPRFLGVSGGGSALDDVATSAADFLIVQKAAQRKRNSTVQKRAQNMN